MWGKKLKYEKDEFTIIYMDATNFLFVDYPEDYVRTTRAERDMALCVFARLLAYFSV